MKQDPQVSGKIFEWQPNVKIVVFSLLLFPILIAFGFWQLERAEETRELLQEFNLTKHLTPHTF